MYTPTSLGYSVKMEATVGKLAFRRGAFQFAAVSPTQIMGAGGLDNVAIVGEKKASVQYWS